MKSKYGFETTQERSALMGRIKSTNTTPEIKLRKYLWKLGYRYRKNYSAINGKPDIVFIKKKVAIFIDGEFWHGYLWDSKKEKIKNNKKYWVKKIEGNIRRDLMNNNELRKHGWRILRFWEHEIKNDIEYCASLVISLLEN
jgi:DNA mismatch endonuclease (patch repair protein)